MSFTMGMFRIFTYVFINSSIDIESIVYDVIAFLPLPYFCEIGDIEHCQPVSKKTKI